MFVRVSGSSNMATIYIPKNTQKDSPAFPQEKVLAKTSSQNSKTDIYEQIAKDYDIRHASHKELCEISKKLYEKGEISLLDHAILTFNPELSPPDYIKHNYPNYKYFLTKADLNGKRDWIAEFGARVQQDKKIGNTQGSVLNQKLVDVLMHLQRK